MLNETITEFWLNRAQMHVEFHDVACEEHGLSFQGTIAIMTNSARRPQDGKLVTFSIDSPSATEIASGVPLIVDVELGPGRRLYALSNGVYSGDPEGSPGRHNTGSILAVNADGTFTPLVTGLDQPTSLELIGNTAFVVTFPGEVWRFDNLTRPPFGISK